MIPPESPRRIEPVQAEEVPSSDAESRSASPTSKPYRSPRLVSYGRLTQVTQFGGSQILDSGGNLGNLE